MHYFNFQSQADSSVKHELDEFEYVDVDGEETGAPRVTKKELLEEGTFVIKFVCFLPFFSEEG